MFSKYTIFVRKLPFLTTPLKLRRHFEKFGGVSFVDIIYDYETGRPKKYAFVAFEDSEGLKKAVKEEVQTFIGEKIIIKEHNRQEK